MKKKYLNWKRFNFEVAEYLKKTCIDRNDYDVYKMMIKINELFAIAAKGNYASKDEIWIDKLCWENLKVFEEVCWEQFPAEEKDAQDLLAYMSICELTAKKAGEETKEDYFYMEEELKGKTEDKTPMCHC